MLGMLLAHAGLNTLKKQIIAGVFVTLVVIVSLTFKAVVHSWKSDIEGRAAGEVANAVKDDQIETLRQGKEIDETVLQSDDAALCAVLGGCLQREPETASTGDGD